MSLSIWRARSFLPSIWVSSEDAEQVKKIRRGWCYGSETFRAELLEQMEKSFGRHHGGMERQESAEAKAERLLVEEFERRGWNETNLEQLAKGDAQKVEIASRLRKETTMTWDWIARNLGMGAGAYAANCVRLYQKRIGKIYYCAGLPLLLL